MEDWATSPGAERLTVRIEAVIEQARSVRTGIHDAVLPQLHPVRRLGAERLLRQIDSRQLFGAAVLDEIEALIRHLSGEIAAGTTQAFRVNEFDPSHGYVESVHDERAEILAPVPEELRSLHRRVSAVLDALEAERIAATLLDPN